MTQSIFKSILAGAVFVAGSFLTNGAIAQNGAINKAEFYLTGDKPSYEKALENIRAATYHEKTKDKARTWYVRANVFTTIFEIGREDAAVAALVTNPMDSAFAAINTALEIEKAEGKDTYTKKIEDEVFQTETGIQSGLKVRIRGAILTEVQKYQDAEFEKAYQAMIPLVTYFKPDTTYLSYIGYFADKAEKLDKAAMYYEKLADIEEYDGSKEAYQSASYAYYRLNDTTNFLRVLNKASTKFPQETYFIVNAADIHIQQKEYDKAIALLNKAYTLEPTKTNYLLQIARMYEQEENKEKAMEYYTKIVEVEPLNYDANYTIAAHYYRLASGAFNELDAKDRLVTNPKMKLVIENADKSIFYFKKAVEANSEEESLYMALKDLYYLKDDQKNSDLMKEKIEAMKGK